MLLNLNPVRFIRAMLAATTCFAMIATCIAESSCGQTAGQDNAHQIQQECERLIKQLAADSYQDREEAKLALQKHGEAAFDALYAARQSDDVETRFASRAVLQSIRIPWTQPEDSDEAKLVMGNFQAETENEKLIRIMRLDGLKREEAVRILSRVARFELNERLSKQAALVLMKMKHDSGDAKSTGDLIRSSIGACKRTPGKWLSRFADLLEGQPDAWNELSALISQELADFKLHPKSRTTSQSIVYDLLRWKANRKLMLGDKADAYDQFRELISMTEGDREALLDCATWISRHQTWPLMIEMQAKFPVTFDGSPLLLYYTATAKENLGAPTTEVQEIAEQAIAVESENARQHVITGIELQERGLKKWATREYEKVLNDTEVAERWNLHTMSMLAEMLFDMGQAERAAEVMRATVEAIQQNTQTRATIEKVFNRDPETIIARRHYFLSQHFQRTGDMEKAMHHLLEGIEHETTDADILIAMYRFPDPSGEFVKETKDRIDTAVGRFRTDIQIGQERLLEPAIQEADARDARRSLAVAYNQFAWLVCNTAGDFQEAIRASHKSLELRPDTASYYDTLAHCYYAINEFEQTVRYQRRAVELEPYEVVLSEKLVLFEKALKEGKKPE